MFYERITHLLPQKMQNAFKREMEYLDLSVDNKKLVGFIIFYGFFLSTGVALNAHLFFQINPIIAFTMLYAIIVGGFYLMLSLSADAKGKFVESILPDALQLVASNMKSGLTAERALLVSA